MGVKYYWNTRIILTLFFLNVHVSLNSLKWVVIAKEMAVNYFGITSVLGQFFVEDAIKVYRAANTSLLVYLMPERTTVPQQFSTR